MIDLDFFSLYTVVSKALDPNNAGDFVQIVNQLKSATAGLAGAAEADALRRALKTLDVDWEHMNAAARSRVYDAAKQTVNPSKLVLPKVEAKLLESAETLGKRTKASAVKEHNLRISPNLTRVDQRVLRHVAESQGLFIRDHYGNRADRFGALAKEIVETGLARGDNRKKIAAALHEKLSEAGVDRSRSYWQLIAGTFANRARTYSNLSSYAEAGITHFRFEAVRDERTSAVCRFMHGKRFPVDAALGAYAKTEALDDPEQIVDTQPWVSSGKDADGNDVLYLRSSSGARRQVARIEDSGVGRVDDSGKFKPTMNDKQLQAAGVMVPPLHGHCRSTIVPDGATTRGSKPKPLPRPPPPPKPVEPPKPPSKPPSTMTPEVFVPKVYDAFKAFEMARRDFPGPTPESKAAQKEIRRNLRAFVASQFPGATSMDEAHKLAEKDSFGVAAKAAMGGAVAYHDWAGRVVFEKSAYERLVPTLGAMRSATTPGGSPGGRRSLSEFSQYQADPIRTLIHEELHGHSRITPSAYRSVGVGMEEAQTEILARKITRKLLGETAEDPTKAKHFALPEVSSFVDYRGDRVINGGYGSYQVYIGRLLSMTTEFGKVPREKVAKVVEDTFTSLIAKKGPRFTDPGQHVDAFVDELAATHGVPAESASLLRAALKNPKNGMAPRRK